MRYHINPATGEPGRCSAKNGGCPFGGENEHYTSPEAAREAFEASNSDSTFSMSLKDMNSLAKTANDSQVIAGIIAKGSDRTLNNLAKNPNLTPQDVKTALAKTRNPAVRANLLVANNGPAELMEPADLEEILAKLPAKEQHSTTAFYRNGDKIARLVNNPYLTDEHYEQVINSSRIPAGLKNRFAIILGDDNKISPQKTRAFIEAANWRNYPVNADRALVNKKLTEQDLMDAPDKYLDNFSATGPSKILGTREVDILGQVAVKKGHDRLQMWVAKDSRTSSHVLDTMGRFSLQSEHIYKNPNTSNHIKARIAEKDASKPYIRMDELRNKIGDAEYLSILKAGGGSQLGRAYSQTETIFDMEKVRKYNLTNDDVFYMAGARGFNGGTRFNPDTGVFSGYIDSSD